MAESTAAAAAAAEKQPAFGISSPVHAFKQTCERRSDAAFR